MPKASGPSQPGTAKSSAASGVNRNQRRCHRPTLKTDVARRDRVKLPRKRGELDPQHATARAANRRTWGIKAAGLDEKALHRLSAKTTHQVRHPLPFPPPLPAGKGSESPSVVKGAGCAALRLLLLPHDGERRVVPRASRIRFASILIRSVLGLRPPLRMRLPVESLTPFPLKQPSDAHRRP